MISARIENIIVVIGASIEMPPKEIAEIAIVELIANTDAKIATIIYLLILSFIFFGLSKLTEISPKTIIPNVARADSQSEISNMA